MERNPPCLSGRSRLTSLPLLSLVRQVTGLVSKGATGGRYRYSDPSTSAGSWIYRVKDCDASGVENVLCQCFVEVREK